MSVDILIVDDDPHIRDVIDYALTSAGFSIRTAENGIEALQEIESKEPALVVLDVGMPEMDGFECCRQVRKRSGVPILFLSARDEEIEKIVGLEIGGDDYVTKPFSPRELVARVKAILKRVPSPATVPGDGGHVSVGQIQLCAEARTCAVSGRLVDLTKTEFDILAQLMVRPGVVCSRSVLLDSAWGVNIHVSDRTIDSHVRNLRGKLRDAGCGGAIRTVHGVGFQLSQCL